MLKGLFDFVIVSAYDREKLTCEICFQKKIVAEICQETKELTLEIYPAEKNECWQFPLVAFQQAVEDGKNFLLESNKEKTNLFMNGDFTIRDSYEQKQSICEIFYKKELIGKVFKDSANLMLEIFPPKTNKWWEVPFKSFQLALEKARQKFVAIG